MGLATGLGGARPVEEVGPTDEAGPVGLEAESVSRQSHTEQVYHSLSTHFSTDPGSGARTR